MAKQEDDKKKELDPRIMAIAKKLETLRIKKGYSSYENFAIEFGISRMQYWRMEKGTNFTFASFLKILDAHEMTLNEFFKDISLNP
ncbi:helix-turn-helix domain-containing protein [Flagellimonas sp. HMM57]|uniref:helix-turn-helix domain-containing protein n=1 Tax=unclassified Flagellimonas TaxID=2644544 RepID=UPI0013D5A65A|nr:MULTISPECIES: helix-turn-helix transcriptional regulator [unclassified Flagellimonas]UII75469.1 helix-turn-helix domain-containing protein [Flagellimonas sp. HMM57]